MKKFFAFIAAALVAFSAAADEGMWLLPLLQKFNADAMRNIGCRLTPEDIYSINHSSLKDAIVQFGGGCTGEIISGDGLLVTNHHCGYSSIQRLSTPEKNYLEDGFFALSREQEIPVPGLSVTFMKSMQDVTSAIEKLDGKSREEVQAAVKKIEEQAEKDNPNCVAEITSFYNDNVYYLIIYKVYRDVRFVAAPPAAMGKFGGETDNWMWPRHTCDFSMFRVYAGADNEPAEYSANNVPLKPVRSLKISLKGVKQGDFAMVMGYPGRTQRFQTAVQLEDMIATNRVRIDARTVRQNVMWDEMEKDPAVRLQYANKYASSANGWKKWQGEELAFDKLGIISREKQKEADFNKWVNARGKRQKAYAGAIETIDSTVLAAAAPMRAYTLLSETVGQIELLSMALMDRGDNQYKDFNPAVDKKITRALLKHYLDNVEPADKIAVPGLEKDNLDAYVDKLYTSVFLSPEARAAASDSAKLADPAMQLATEVVTKIQEIAPSVNAATKARSEASRKYTAGLMAWQKGQPSYPDANFTMRLTYGTVLPYSPKDGVSYWYYTTTNGLIEKEDPDNYEFRLPAKVKELALVGDFGRYADADGKLRTCFLTNNDITGGNSGSPVLDADGNLIGLAFDGNWESMSSDVMFEPDLQRCISVDIRYVLWMVEKFGGADNIIKELTFAK